MYQCNIEYTQATRTTLHGSLVHIINMDLI